MQNRREYGLGLVADVTTVAYGSAHSFCVEALVHPTAGRQAPTYFAVMKAEGQKAGTVERWLDGQKVDGYRALVSVPECLSTRILSRCPS